MPPRQRTTFKNKKPTTTYSYVEDRPTSASERLDTFIRSNQDKKNQSPGLESVLRDMPKKRADFVRRNTREDGSLNSAALAMLAPYQDDRSQYSREMNRLRTSSPEMMKAYAKRFPLEDFAMNMGPTIAGAITGIPLGLLERGFDKTKKGFDFAKSGAGQGLDAVLSAIDKGMSAAESGLDRLSGDTGNMIKDTGEIIRSTGGDLINTGGDLKDDAMNIFQEAIAKREEPSTFTVENRPIGNPLEQLIIDSQSVDTPGVERLFKLPTGSGFNFQGQDGLGNYLVNDPRIRSVLGPMTAMNLNQGGLASLNNRDYGMLMGASNFGF